MSIKISNDGGLDGFFDDVMTHASDEAHEYFAQELAKKARDLGLQTADSIEVNASSDSDEFPIDGARVKRRANEILSTTE